MKILANHIALGVGIICLYSLFGCSSSNLVTIPEEGKYDSILKDSIYNEHQDLSFSFIEPYFLEPADKEAFSYIFSRDGDLNTETFSVSFLILDKSKMSYKEFKEKKNFMNEEHYSKYFIEEGLVELNNRYEYTLMDNGGGEGNRIKVNKIWLQFFTELPDRNVRITVSQYGFENEFLDKNYDIGLAVLQSVIFH